MTVEDDENRRLFEHFIVAGLSENAEELTPLEHECGNKPNETLAPITDITIIFPGLGETVPFGFTCIETTPSGFPADLNHGSIRTAAAFLCYRRGYHKPPLVDIGLMDEGKKERPMEDSTVIQYTPNGHAANVSNTSNALYFTCRRCQISGPPHQLVITNISVILTNKGETPPHTFYKIDKNLNRAMVGSDVYVCYKKAQSCCRRIAYKPAVLDCFPKADHVENSLAQNVPMFCLPMGALIESWSVECGTPEQLFSTCVLTESDGTKYYGASLTFYEKYTKELTTHQKELLSFEVEEPNRGDEGKDDDKLAEEAVPEQLFFVNKSICIVSRHPFFECFRRFLYYVYVISASPSSQTIPIERYISHLMYEVPFPTPLRPRVLVQLGDDMVPFENHDDGQVPLSGAQFVEVLKSLRVDNFIYVMSLALLEQKILIHSLRPWLLTVVSETICALMFPFHWQCPYIPQCPLALAGVLHAPLPFIAGVDSRYFDLYEDPPGDVICFDLDTATVRHSVNKKWIKQAILPKKPLKRLKVSLESILEKIRADDRERDKWRRQKAIDGNGGPADLDQQLQMRRASYEVAIRESFLRFMCALMTGYTYYLRPIQSCPRNTNATDITSRFDLEGFLRSRDNASEFYKRFSETQCFIRFIEERSFMSDKVVYNAFFDDSITRCLMKPTADLLDRDVYAVNHTIVVPPPRLLDSEHSSEAYSYNGFPNHFNHDLFESNEIKLALSAKPSDAYHSIRPNTFRFACIRTKNEIRNSFELGLYFTQHNPLTWPKIMLFYGYSLWFLQLPSLLHLAKNKVKVLRLAISVLLRIDRSSVSIFDQVCYRLLMQLCGEHGYPWLAVDVLRMMRRQNISPNAITYAVYHKAVLEGEWPTESRLNAIDAWHRIRVRLDVCSRFLAVRRDPNFLHRTREQVQFEPAFEESGLSMENISAMSIEDNNGHSSLPSTPELDATSRSSRDLRDEDKSLETQPYVMTVLPLDSKKSETFEPVTPVTTENSDADPLSASLSRSDSSTRTAYPAVSPSREQFMREHSASPFQKDLASLDGRLSVKRKSVKSGASSWLKKLTSSPVVSNLMRSHTTDDIKSPSPNTSVNELNVSSTMTMSPSFSSIVNSVRKQALKGYDVVSQHGNTLFKKSGVNSLMAEVKNLNKSYSRDASFVSNTSINDESFNGTMYGNPYDIVDPAFQLDSGSTGDILPIEYWMRGLFDCDSNSNDVGNSLHLDVSLCTCSSCPRCNYSIYDEELISGWTVDDCNLNTMCPFCQTTFAPSLKVNIEQRSENVGQSWYVPFQSSPKSNDGCNQKTTDTCSESLSVPFVSCLVLRREIESLLTTDVLALADPALRVSHPIIFWNMIYYLRRLDLPSYLYSWISKDVHIRCVYDQRYTKTIVPLYITNHAADSSLAFAHYDRKIIANERRMALWKQTIELLKSNNLLQAMQNFCQEYRDVNPITKTVALRSHVSIYRDILFVALDFYKRNVDREQFDRMYEAEFSRLPVRIAPLLDPPDRPPKSIVIACRRIFLPLDVY